MPLPEKIIKRLEEGFVSKEILDAELTKQVMVAMNSGKAINWNLVLNKQLKIEKGGADEADH